MPEREWRTEEFDGYSVIDKGNGLSTIVVPDAPRPEEAEPAGLWDRIKRWWKGANAKPVVKVVDMNNPTGRADDGDCARPKPAVFVGIKVDF